MGEELYDPMDEEMPAATNTQDRTLLWTGIALLLLTIILGHWFYGNAELPLRVTAALAAGLVGSFIPGFLNVDFQFASAGGAFACFLLAFAYSPAAAFAPGSGCTGVLEVKNSSVDYRTATLDVAVEVPTACAAPERISIDWGDGTSEDAAFPASHDYSTAGTYQVDIVAHHPGWTESPEVSTDVRIPQYARNGPDGKELVQGFSHASEDRHNKGAKEASGRYTLSETAGRIYKVEFSHGGGEGCGWNYNPDGGYTGNAEIVDGGRSFVWKRRWDGKPCIEIYDAYYEIPVVDGQGQGGES